jgi:hypothetical protein
VIAFFLSGRSSRIVVMCSAVVTCTCWDIRYSYHLAGAPAARGSKTRRLTRAPSDRGRQKVARTIQALEGEDQILRRLSEDGLAG